MRTELKSGAALLTAILFALPLSAGAADKAGTTEKPSSTMDKMENKAKETTQEVKGATSDSWLTSKTKIALFADDRVKGREVRVVHADHAALDHAGDAPVGVLPAHVPDENAAAEVKL